MKEIADILETPEGTVKSQLNRGRNRLKEILETDYPEKFGGKGRSRHC